MDPRAAPSLVVATLAAVTLAAVTSGAASAQQALPPGAMESDPPVPAASSEALSGAFAGAVRVALVDSGVNYTLPAIAAALARHPDGTLVGHDFRDLDARPFDRHPLPGGRIARHGTRTASVLIDEAPDARLVPYRFPQTDMTRMAALVEHAAANDVRVVGLPLGGPKRPPWDAFERAARAHPEILFVASAGNDGRDIDTRPVWPAALPLGNLVVVTSADDFGRLAEGVNRGRTGVDYLVPAEHVPVLQFDGSRSHAAGSSYAVPRVVALAARLLAAEPGWGAPELVAELRRRFADGSRPREVGEGFIVDPLAVGERAARVVARRVLEVGGAAERVPTSPDVPTAFDSPPVPPSEGSPGVPSDAPGDAPPDGLPDARANAPSDVSPEVPLDVPLDVIVPNAAWDAGRVERALARAASILSSCAIRLDPVRVLDVDAPERLADLSLGGARTLFDAVRASGPERRATLVLARDTRMQDPYDGEAFGRGNTRHRPWLADSVWLTARVRDEGIALAHELFHVLANSGAHDEREDNLMRARTSGDNVRLDRAQCDEARRVALESGTARESAS